MASKAVGASQPSNFGRLLASSRFASYQPGLHQVYTASPANRGRGNFGIKHNLPMQHLVNGAVRYIDVEDMDTALGGQTRWTEREHEVLLRKRAQEMNESKPAAGSGAERSRAGSKGPRISTTYDPSSRRPVPTHYATVKDDAMRTQLERMAREGRGPVYPADVGVGPGAGAQRSMNVAHHAALKYTDSLPVSVDYQGMDDKTFEIFLTHLRRRRPEARRFLTYSAAVAARRELVLQYERVRDELRRSGEEHIPERIKENDLALPEIDVGNGDQGDAQPYTNAETLFLDLFDQSRQSQRTSTAPLWRLWLARQKTSWLLDASSQKLSPYTTSVDDNKATPLHPNAGLKYGVVDPIGSQLLAEALPARVLDAYKERTSMTRVTRNSNTTGVIIATGGRVAKASHGRAHDANYIDWTQRNRRKGAPYVKPLWNEENHDGNANYYVNGVDKPLPIDQGEQRVLQVRTASRADEEENMTTAGRYAGDAFEVRRARGMPGSTRWIGEFDGHKPQEQAFAVDYGSKSGMSAPRKSPSRDAPWQAEGKTPDGGDLSSRIRSDLRRTAARRNETQEADVPSSSKTNMQYYTRLLKEVREGSS